MTESGVYSTPKPQSQSVDKCSTLRQECRDSIFNKMDNLHTEQMKELVTIKTDVAYMKGKQESNPIMSTLKKNGNGKDNLVTKILLSPWGPIIAVIVLLGIIALSRSKGWL